MRKYYDSSADTVKKDPMLFKEEIFITEETAPSQSSHVKFRWDNMISDAVG